MTFYNSFYLHENLVLDALTAEHSRTDRYKNSVEKVRAELRGYISDRSLRGPMELIVDVLKAGAHTGRVGEAEKRMRIAVLEYGKALSDRLDVAHYLLWLMPTVGFLGTIYGISSSLVRAKGLFGSSEFNPNKFSENIQLVVDGLGVAFDTTSMALLCSAILYWFITRSEINIRDLVDDARSSLSKLVVDRMVDRSNVSISTGDVKIEEN